MAHRTDKSITEPHYVRVKLTGFLFQKLVQAAAAASITKTAYISSLLVEKLVVTKKDKDALAHYMDMYFNKLDQIASEEVEEKF